MISVAILAGGGSRRMGSNKAFLPFLGVPLIERVVSRVHPIADECFIVGPPDIRYERLGLVVHADAVPGKNALGGLYTACLQASHPYVVVVGCDMPFVNEPLLKAQIQVILQTPADGVVPRTRLGLEPLHAVYRAERCAHLIEHAMKDGMTRLVSWMGWADIHFLAEDTINRFDPEHLAFENINTPDDLARAEDLAR